MSKSQAWSLDIMLAVIIFIGTILFFYLTIGKNEQGKVEALEDEASDIIEMAGSKNSTANILDGDEINIKKLEALLEKNYTDIKNKLRVKNEFCIYFEDENGNIVHINGTYLGIGSDIINISDVPCG